MSARVASLHIYPVKSCGGIQVETLEIRARGPELDREWMIVYESTKSVVTQRKFPKLALIKLKLTSSSLILSVPQSGRDPVEISLPRGHIPSSKIEVTVGDDKCEACEVTPLASLALSDFLGTPVQLVRIAQDYKRILKRGVRPDIHIGFVDKFPAMLVSRDSLEELNRKLREPVPVDRFRPTIVIEGEKPYKEDRWRQVVIGNVGFDFVELCGHTNVVNIDQATGLRGVEPLMTLAQFRSDAQAVPRFGQSLAHLNEGTIRVGDEVYVLE